MIQEKYFMICLQAAISKIPRNLLMCFVTLGICVVLGMLAALLRTYRLPVISKLLDVFIALCKAFPANLILLICIMVYTYKFNDFAAFFHLKMSIRDVNLIYIAVIGLTIVSFPGISEVLRSGLIAIPRGQFEAGYAVGMTAFQTFRDIIFPQMFRVVIPPLTNSILSLLKMTALVNVMGVSDILKSATDAATESYAYLEAYTAAALVFWVLGIVIEQISKMLEKYFAKSVKQIA
ncbi:amino acid ABC transporter permease [Lachnospiraceae bacterium 42-17]|nr:amino acid ABC transporter permease [Dorea sp.]